MKYAPESATAIIQFHDGPVVCKTAMYREAIFTSANDHSVGQRISLSNTNMKYFQAIAPDMYDNPLSYLRVLYSRYAFHGYELDLSHCQIVHCDTAFYTEGGACRLKNVLLYDVGTAFSGGAYQATAWHLTIDQCQNLSYDSSDPPPGGSSLVFTNCLLLNVTNTGDVSYSMDHTVLTNGNGVFQTVAGGSHYLADDSPYRDAGTTDVSTNLLQDFAHMTTYPPMFISNVSFTVDTRLEQTAPRDTDQPDLGFHFPAMDYASYWCFVTNQSTLTLAPGVVVAMAGPYSFYVMDGSTLVAQGTPLQHNHFIPYTAVQEGTVSWSYPNNGQFYHVVPYNTTGLGPSARFRFTDFSAFGGEYMSPMYSSYYSTWSWTNVTVQDCAFYAGGLDWECPPTMTAGFTNNLFYRLNMLLSGDMHLAFFNNVLYQSSCGLWPNIPNRFEVRNNVFDGTYTDDEDEAYVNLHSHNAYIALPDPAWRLHPTNASDVVLDTFDWQTGPLGDFYQPINSSLTNAGSCYATNVGFYHFTTQTNQLKEGDTWLDIGLHYVAIDPNTGRPCDTDGDGIPDYLEDRNGNGETDGDETGWNDYNSRNGLSGTPGFEVFTPLKH